MASELLTIAEVAGILRVPKSWIYARTCDGAQEVLPHLKFGRHLRFERERIVAWMETRRRGVEPSVSQPEGVEKRQQ
jgi:excisionase family DNA binding protein